jgi:pimeloyl-ACP methyl ester carboxylesterase
LAGPRAAPPPRGRLIDIGGRRLHWVRAGPDDARISVLLEAGSFGFSADWSVVQERLAARGLASMAYDRAGLGHSDPGPAPRDGLAVVRDLEALLAAAGEAGPFVYVGHSMAGLHAHLFAGRNPDRISGLVLVDAVTPAAAEDPAARRIAGHYVRLSKIAAWAAGAGLFRLLEPLGDPIGLPPEDAAHKRWAFADGGHNRAAADEVIQWRAAVDQAKAAGPLDSDWPVAVVTAGPAAWVTGRQRRVMTEPARASHHGLQTRVAAANHASLVGRKHADAVIEAIEHVRAASRRT